MHGISSAQDRALAAHGRRWGGASSRRPRPPSMGKPAACHAEVPPATLQTRSLSKSSTCVSRTVAWADRRPDWQMTATCIKQVGSSQQKRDKCTAWWALTALQALRPRKRRQQSAGPLLADDAPHLPLVLPVIQTPSTCGVCQGIQRYIDGTCTAAALPLDFHRHLNLLTGSGELHIHNMQVACPAASHCHHPPGARMAWCSANFMLLLLTRYHALMATAKAALERHISGKERHG